MSIAFCFVFLLSSQHVKLTHNSRNGGNVEVGDDLATIKQGFVGELSFLMYAMDFIEHEDDQPSVNCIGRYYSEGTCYDVGLGFLKVGRIEGHKQCVWCIL